jgi:hypothetical protein
MNRATELVESYRNGNIADTFHALETESRLVLVYFITYLDLAEQLRFIEMAADRWGLAALKPHHSQD